MAEPQTAWVVRAGCGCISAVSVMRYSSLEQAWAKLVGGVSDQRRAVAKGVTLSLQDYDARLLAEIRDSAINCDHPQVGMKEVVVRARAFVADMDSWCSPYGIAQTYAKRLRGVLDGEGPGELRTTCPFCPDAGEMGDANLVEHIATVHRDIEARRRGAAKPRHDFTAARLVTIMGETQIEAAADDQSRNWMEDAAKRILAEIAHHLDEAIADVENEQTDLMRRRQQAGFADNAMSHALRARAHKRDRHLIRGILADGDHD